MSDGLKSYADLLREAMGIRGLDGPVLPSVLAHVAAYAVIERKDLERALAGDLVFDDAETQRICVTVGAEPSFILEAAQRARLRPAKTHEAAVMTAVAALHDADAVLVATKAEIAQIVKDYPEGVDALDAWRKTSKLKRDADGLVENAERALLAAARSGR